MLFGLDDSSPAEPARTGGPLAAPKPAEPHVADSDDNETNGTASRGRTDSRLPWLFAALGLLAGLAIGLAVWALWPTSDDDLTQDDIDTAIEAAVAEIAAPASASLVYDQIAPSLVVVRAWLGDIDDEDAKIGTGVVINERGQVLTSDHIVANASALELTFANGSTVRGQLVSSEPSQDIAVLEAAENPGALTPATMGNSRTLSIGDPIFALGHPLGLTGSISAGVISGLNRDIGFPDDEEQLLEDLIQFDAAVNQGNSGGPLLNTDGHVVGIVTALADPSNQGYFIGIGFAVPIDIAAGGAASGPSQ